MQYFDPRNFCTVPHCELRLMVGLDLTTCVYYSHQGNSLDQERCSSGKGVRAASESRNLDSKDSRCPGDPPALYAFRSRNLKILSVSLPFPIASWPYCFAQLQSHLSFNNSSVP